MKHKLLSLAVAALLSPPLLFAAADDVTVYSDGQKILGVGSVAGINFVSGDQVKPSEKMDVVIYSEEDQKGRSHVMKHGDTTPFPFKSLKIVPSSQPPEHTTPGLYVAVADGMSCVHIALELDDTKHSGWVDLYPPSADTYTLTEMGQPLFRKFTLFCPSSSPLNIDALAKSKFQGGRLGKMVLLTVVDTALNYEFMLKGYLPTREGSSGDYKPDNGLDYMGNYSNWEDVFSLKETGGGKNSFIVIDTN